MRWLVALAFILFLSLSAFWILWLRYDLRSYSLLIHFVDPQASGALVHWESNGVTTRSVMISTPSGLLKARLYSPEGILRPPGMVVVHGIHHLGMEEPRLVAFSRAVAQSGFAVLTPQLDALADYHVEASSISFIGESAKWLEQQLGGGPVTVTGVSFAGGISLLAACDPAYAVHIRALVLMGAYDDLSRVSRFLVTSHAELPDGSVVPYAAHEYGALVFIYDHLDQFSPAADLPMAHQALRTWLWERPDEAKPWLARLSKNSRATMELLFSHQVASLRPQLLGAIRADRRELDMMSPQGHLAGLRLPVYILHGLTDEIIPSTESLWLEREVPQGELRDG